MEEERCRLCGERKSLDLFHRAAGTRDGRRRECIACFRNQWRERYYASEERRRIAAERAKRWADEHPDNVQASKARRRKSGQIAVNQRRVHPKMKYGLAPEDYDRMLEGQGGACAICCSPPASGKHLHVDHDHDTGAVRGLLCFRCNAGMGQFDDDPARVLRLHAYLVRHRDRTPGSDGVGPG